MEKINVEAIIRKRIAKFPSNPETPYTGKSPMTDENIMRNVKAAIKEIVEAVVDKCANSGATGEDMLNILKVKEELNYE